MPTGELNIPRTVICCECGAERAWLSGSKPTWCVACSKARKKEQGRRSVQTWRDRNPEKAREAVRAAQARYASDERLRRDGRLRIQYGITIFDFEALELAQGGVCAVCKTRPETPLCVDHNHSCCVGRTKRCCVRGLLCQTCNRSFGLLGDSSATLRAGADYLDRWAA